MSRQVRCQELLWVGKVSCSITFLLRDSVIVRLPILFAVVVATGPTCSCLSRGSAKVVLMKRTAFGIPVDRFRPAHGGSSASTRSIRWTSPFPLWSSALSVGHSTLSLLWPLSSWVARPELFSQIGIATAGNHGPRLRFFFFASISFSVHFTSRAACRCWPCSSRLAQDHVCSVYPDLLSTVRGQPRKEVPS